MSYLSDRDIRKRLASEDPDFALRVLPLMKDAVQPASIDVRLGRDFLQPDSPPGGIVRPGDPGTIRMRRIRFDEQRPVYHMRPGEALLGVTHERIVVPPDMMVRLEGKSSLARLFLTVHITAGIVDPGWDGHLTFEFVNLNPFTMELRYLMPIAQLVLSQLSSPAERPYGHPSLGSKYQGDDRPTASKYRLNLPEDE